MRIESGFKLEDSTNSKKFQELTPKAGVKTSNIEKGIGSKLSDILLLENRKQKSHFLWNLGDFTLLLGRQKIGKTSSLSYLILELLAQVSDAQVLFFAFENSREDIAHKLLLHSRLFTSLPEKWQERIWLFDRNDLRKLRRRLSLKDVEIWVKEFGTPALVIFDPLAGIKELGDLVDKWHFGEVYDFILSALLPFAEDLQIHLLVIHHLLKSSSKFLQRLNYEIDIVPQVMSFAYGSGALISAPFGLAALVEDPYNFKNRILAYLGREGQGEEKYFFDIEIVEGAYLYKRQENPVINETARLLNREDVALFCKILLLKGGRASYSEIIEEICKKLNLQTKEEKTKIYHRLYDIVFRSREYKRYGISLEGLGLIRKLDSKTIEATENLIFLLREKDEEAKK